ncbi:hypothetical protein [Streptomyces sp. DH12]|uniref:hypothetical protein n=1 Tax=Streptomyces sp. DH12 TaxID=2857010 RepID=UPI001E2E4FB1|nr:hypothetical protein [Streptomyces sp. DH12]
MSTRLWDVDHPYYCAEGNHFKTGQHTRWPSWQEFAETLFVTGDRDLSLLFRWDWHRPDPDDYEPGEQVPADTLLLFFVIQRKGFNCSHAIAVTEADEPAVRAFLTECAETMRATWEPLLGSPARGDTPTGRTIHDVLETL